MRNEDERYGIKDPANGLISAKTDRRNVIISFVPDHSNLRVYKWTDLFMAFQIEAYKAFEKSPVIWICLKLESRPKQLEVI